MGDPSILDLDPSEQAEIEEQVFRVLANDALDLLEDVVEDDLAGLLLELCQFGDGCRVELDGREGEVDLILHLHAALDQKLLHQAKDELLAALLRGLRAELHCIGPLLL